MRPWPWNTIRGSLHTFSNVYRGGCVLGVDSSFLIFPVVVLAQTLRRTSSALTNRVLFCEEGKKKRNHEKKNNTSSVCKHNNKTHRAASLLLSRIIYCSSLFIPLFQFINNNYRFKSWEHLQSIQTYYIHPHYNQWLSNRSLSQQV